MSWDLYAKALLKECPQDFVTLLLRGARYIGAREGQFQTREMRTDTLIEAEYEGQPLLIHVEFQSEKDKKMDERLLGYNYEATRLHELPMLSCVIYLQRVNDAPQPPLCRNLPNGQRILWFDYVSIELAERSVEQLQELHLDVVLPLLILSKDGARREVLDEVVTRLDAEHKQELLLHTRLFAGLVFKSPEDQMWIARRFAMLRDFLRENSWTYQEIVQEGIEQGREQGTRQNIEAMVQARFPNVLPVAKEQIASITDWNTLQTILVTVGTARSAKEIRKFLLTLKEPQA